MHVIAICAYSYSRNSEDSVSNAVILASDVTAQSSDASIFEPHENAWHSTEAARDYDDGDVGRLIICAGMSQIAPSEPPSNAINIPSLTEASAVAAPATGNGGFWAQVSTNSLFTAGLGLAGLGIVLSTAQKGLRQSASLLKRRLLVDVEISVKDESYQWFLHWMTAHQRAQLAHNGGNTGSPGSSIQGLRILDRIAQRVIPRTHHLSISTEKVEKSNGAVDTRLKLVPGPGRHLLRYKNTFLLVNRIRETKSMDLQLGRPWETVTLTTLYSKRQIFEDIFTEAYRLAQESSEGKTSVYISRGASWEQFGEARRKRPLESVVLDRGVKEHIVADVKDFLGSGRWYYDRGIPYRRGYLLHGPPGSGKSSFVQALAGDLDYNIAMLNLSERGLTDDRLNHLLSIIPRRSLVLLEDADAAFSNKRTQTDADGYRGANVTFSGLLNALDGVASAEERILFLTTNHVERLDSALVRPGRVDMTVRLGEATRWQAGQLWDRFYGDVDGGGQMKQLFLQQLERCGLVDPAEGSAAKSIEVVQSGISTAALQGIFLYNKGNMKGAIKMVGEISTPDRNSSNTVDNNAAPKMTSSSSE